MSFILDALNRSDTDRDQEHEVPGIQTVHGPGSSESAPLWKRFIWPALALLFALLAAAAWLANPGAPEQTVEQVPEPASMPKPVASPGPEPVAAPSQPAPKPDAGQQADIAALYANKPAPTTASSNEPKPAPAPAQVARLVEQPALASPGAEPQPEPQAPAQESVDVEALARFAQTELDSLQTDREPVVEHEAPFINELRQSVKDQIPSIFYNAHNWSRSPSERSVILNKREFREGQQVKPGLRLVEILPDGIVLDFRGTEFRLRSLNSWVNL